MINPEHPWLNPAWFFYPFFSWDPWLPDDVEQEVDCRVEDEECMRQIMTIHEPTQNDFPILSSHGIHDYQTMWNKKLTAEWKMKSVWDKSWLSMSQPSMIFLSFLLQGSKITIQCTARSWLPSWRRWACVTNHAHAWATPATPATQSHHLRRRIHRLWVWVSTHGTRWRDWRWRERCGWGGFLDAASTRRPGGLRLRLKRKGWN